MEDIAWGLMQGGNGSANKEAREKPPLMTGKKKAGRTRGHPRNESGVICETSARSRTLSELDVTPKSRRLKIFLQKKKLENIQIRGEKVFLDNREQISRREERSAMQREKRNVSRI